MCILWINVDNYGIVRDSSTIAAGRRDGYGKIFAEKTS